MFMEKLMEYKKVLLILVILCSVLIIAGVLWAYFNPESLRIAIDRFFMMK